MNLSNERPLRKEDPSAILGVEIFYLNTRGRPAIRTVRITFLITNLGLKTNTSPKVEPFLARYSIALSVKGNKGNPVFLIKGF